MTPRPSMTFAIVFSAARATVALGGTPTIGDKAPPLSIAKWMTETPPATPGAADAAKYVYLVEFWATWCPPCHLSMPHLAELHKEYRDKGLIVMGISNEEEETLAAFLKKKPLTYYIGCDDRAKTTLAWMENAPGIPHAFLVDRAGVILWIGNPMDAKSLDKAVKLILAGKLTLESAKAAEEEAKRDAMYQMQQQRLLRARQRQDAKLVFEALEEMIKLKPDRAEPYLLKRQMLEEFRRREEIAAFDETIETALGGSLEGMMDLSEAEFIRPLPSRDPQRLLRYIRQAEKLGDGKDPRSLSLAARAQCEVMGELGLAIQTQRKAVESAPDGEREPYQKTLEYYESLKKLRTTAPQSDD